MKKEEAYSLLGIPVDSDKSQVKKAFKKKSVEMHPDKGGNPDEYKKITEAFHSIQNNKFDDVFNTPFQNWQHNPFTNNPFTNAWASFSRSPNFSQHVPEPIKLNVNLTFKESVLGCNKKIKISRRDKCNSCDGIGFKLTDKVCSICNGLRFVTNSKTTTFGQNVYVQTQCSSCNGLGVEQTLCNACNGVGGVSNETSLDVKINGGLVSGNVVGLRGAGHFFLVHSRPTRGQVFLNILVSPEENMHLIGDDIHSKLEVSLLEALKGCKKDIKTIKGNQSITIPEKTKHGDSVTLNNLGVEERGRHIINLSVKYPDDINGLVNFLEENK